MKKAITFLYWIPAVAWALTIYYCSVITYSEKPKLVQDKLQHIVAYFILAFLVYFALRYTVKWSFRTSALIVTGLCVIYAGGIQLNQGHIVSRGGDFDDWLADVAGAALVFMFLLTLKKLGGKGKAIYSLLSNGSDEQNAESNS